MLRYAHVTALLLVVSIALLPALAAESPNLVTAKKALHGALGAGNLKAAQDAIGNILRENSREAVQALVATFPAAAQRGTDWYWAWIKALAAVTSKEALDEVGLFVAKHGGGAPGRDVMFWMQSNYSPHAVEMLLKLVEKAPVAVGNLALDHLGTLRQKSSVAGLIALLDKQVKAKGPLAERVQRALRSITGQDFGGSTDTWRNWWAANKDKPLDAGNEQRGNRTGTVADDMGGGRDYGYGKLIKGDKGKILVIGASKPSLNFDHIENLLQKMQVPHKLVTKEDFNSGKVDLKGVMAIFVNCSNFREHCICPTCKPGGTVNNRMYTCTGCNSHTTYSDKLSNASVKKLVAWVQQGGYLFTEDMGLEEILEVGFGDFVKTGAKLNEQNTAIKPEVGMTSHPYLRRMFARILEAKLPAEGGSAEPPTYESVDHVWKIDNESPAIKIVNRGAVNTLLASEEMATKNKVDRAVAILFGVGGSVDLAGTTTEAKMRGGRVLHVLSHFGKQKSQRDDYTLQNLLLNFLIECNERWTLPGRPGAMQPAK